MWLLRQAGCELWKLMNFYGQWTKQDNQYPPLFFFFSCVYIMLTRPLSSVNYALLLTRVISVAWPQPNSQVVGSSQSHHTPFTCAHVYIVALWVTGNVQRQKDNLETQFTNTPGQDLQQGPSCCQATVLTSSKQPILWTCACLSSFFFM